MLKLQKIHVEHVYHALVKDINIKIIFKEK